MAQLHQTELEPDADENVGILAPPVSLRSRGVKVQVKQNQNTPVQANVYFVLDIHACLLITS